MSDSLKERLNSHSDAFKGLLSLIPAKYYYDDESKSQWNRKKGTKADALRAKQAKFDPNSGSSALDEVNRRETDALGGSKAVVSTNPHKSISGGEAALDESDSDISVIFDDQGNEIYLSGNESGNESTPSVDKPELEKTAASLEGPPKSEIKKKQTPSAPKENPVQQSSGRRAAKAMPKRDSQGIEELRKRLADKITEMRVKRKAPGTNAPGAPKNREELLAARKQRQVSKKRVWDEADADSDTEAADESTADISVNGEGPTDSDAAATGDLGESIMFGQIALGGGDKLGRDMEANEQKRIKKRNAIDQLKTLEGRRAKISALSEEKQKEIANKAQWSRAILQSEGAKVRDNEKLLKKTVKQQQKRKNKSEREWKERLDNVAKGIAAREAKRNANLAARKEAKNSKGKKKKPKRAGFEGKKRRK